MRRQTLWSACYLTGGLLLAAGQSEDDPVSPLQLATNVSSDSLDKIFDEYFTFKKKIFPTAASAEGHKGVNDQVEDYSLDGIRNRAEKCKELYERSKKLTAENSDYELYKDLFEYEIAPCANGLQYKGYLFPPVNIMSSVAVTLPNVIKNTQLDSIQDYEDLLNRLKKVPKMIQQMKALLQEGIKEGYTYAKESFSGVVRKFADLQVDAENSIFYSKFRAIPGSLGRRTVTRLQTSAFNLTKTEILPTLRDFQDFLQFQYSPNLRNAPGISSIPNGEQFYKAALKSYLGSDITPEEIHKIGEEEVAKLLDGSSDVIRDLGLNMTFKEFSEFTRVNSSFKFTTVNEGLEEYRTKLQIINEKLPLIFPSKMLTDEALNAKVASTSDPGIAYYSGGTIYVRLDPIDSSPSKYLTLVLALHEGNPGHHLQSVVSNNKGSVPKFIGNDFFTSLSSVPSRPASLSVGSEGWGLYSEYLGFEMGLYADKFDEFGYYAMNLLRACRLVVDTGIHYFGWSKEQAVQYLLDNTPLQRRAVELEVDRYITMPGQACSYKIGEKNIRRMRSEAENILGDKFDVKEFHTTVITCGGGGPLPMLERCVRRMIKMNMMDTSVDKKEYEQETVGDSSAGTSHKKSFCLIISIVAIITRVR